jgi:hypothetical protein
MSATALIKSHSHYAKEGDGFRLFTADACDDCGHLFFDNGPTVYAPKGRNRATWAASIVVLLSELGLKPAPEDARFGGLYHRESDGSACCNACCAKDEKGGAA